MKLYSLTELNDVLNGVVVGSTLRQISTAEQLEKAKECQVSFIGNKKYERLWGNQKPLLLL